MQTGYYVGNGKQMNISGLGFTPDFLIIKSNTTTISAVFKTSAMPTNATAYFTATQDNEATDIVFHSDGFTVGVDDELLIEENGFSVVQPIGVNITNIRYTYIAFTGSDCSATGNFCVGSYVGNGAGNRDITVGFQPSFVMVKRSSAVAAHYKTATNPANETLYFINLVRDTTGNYLRSFGATTFQVGTTNNTLGGTYYYVAFKTTAGFMKEGTYTANNTDNRSITGVGFKPDFVFVKNATNSTANNTYGVFSIPENYGDHSGYFGALANAVNGIQALETDGFQLGVTTVVNGASSDTHYYVAFKGSSSFSSSGDYLMDTGSYTGNGTYQSIINVKFKPDLIIVKGNTAQVSVFRTSLMAGNLTYILGTGSALENAITNINNDGFTVGTNATVNTNAVVYQWQAFGNAFNPIENSGSSSFAIGSYIGNQIDSRNVTRLPFQPDMIVTKSNQNYNAALRTSTMVGDTAGYFTATADTADVIQLINSDGFQVGTSASNRSSNYSGYIYHWFAFKDSSYFKVGSYTGNGSDNRDINTVGINPNLVWIKQTTAVAGVHKGSSLAGDSTQYFTNTVNATNRVQSLITGGFQVGTGAEVNTGSGVYRYVAWQEPPDPSGTPGTPGTPTFTGVGAGKVTVNWTSAISADSYILERAIELNGSILHFKEITRTTSTTYTDNKGVGSGLKYWYRVVGVNSNGTGTFSGSASVTTSTQTLKMQTGYFMGNQGRLSISNIGFTPEFLIIKSNTATITAVFETSISSSLVAADIQSTGAIADDQLTNINFVNTRYTYIAFSGSDCSATGSFCVGNYTGNGSNPRDITVGFQPNMVIVKRSTAVAAHFKTSTNPANETLYLAGTVRDTSGNFIRSFGATTFQVGSSDNTANGIHHFIAFKNTSGFMKEGSYTANNTDNRSITGVGFKPDFAFVKNATNATAASTNPIFAINESYGDSGSFFSATANAVNQIQALEADGFQVGNNVAVNGSTSDTHYYVAFKGITDPTPSGTFKMAVGTYTGNGTGQSITGLGFKPDLVIVKNNSNQHGVFKTSLMATDSSSYFASATANIESAIRSIDSDGFTIGVNAVVNTSGNTYQWQAFGNAFNPHTNTGSSDFIIGAYYGSGTDTRLINRLPYALDLVAIKSITNAGAGTFRISPMAGDLSTYFANTADAANGIQAINANSFEIGTGVTVNTSAVTYFWFGFKSGTNFAVNTYTGNGTSQNITFIGFQPDLVWAKSNTTVNGVFKPSSLAGVDSQSFAAVANANNNITGLISGGFSVGAGTGANQNAVAYRYAAWKIPVELGTLNVDIVDSGGSSVTSPSMDFSAIDTTFSCQTTTATFGVANEKIRISNQTGTAAWSLSISANSGITSKWDAGGGDEYDYNDNGGSPNGCSDSGVDADLLAGRMSFDFSGATITPQAGCTNTGVTLGSNSSFLQGSTDSIVIAQASGSAQTNCYWDITGISVTQQIPAEQGFGNYSIDMSLSVIAN